MEGQDEEMNNVEMNILSAGGGSAEHMISDDSDGKTKTNSSSSNNFMSSDQLPSCSSIWQLKGYSVKIIALMSVWVVAFATFDKTRNRSTLLAEQSIATVQVKGARLDAHKELMKHAKKVIEQVSNDPNNQNNQNQHPIIGNGGGGGIQTPPPLTNLYYYGDDEDEADNNNVIRGTVPPHIQKLPWMVESHDDRKSVNNKNGVEKAIETAFRHPKLSNTMAHPSKNHEPTKSTTKITSRITTEKPIFVLSLPNSGQMAMNRFFKCSGLTTPGFLGRYWSKIDDLQIGHCMNLNRHGGRKSQPILKTCGEYKVWTEMDYDTKESAGARIPSCLFPSLRPDILEELFETYPEATVMNVIKDPDLWYKTLSPMMKKRWVTSCNYNHNNVFPAVDAPRRQWIQFYNNHHQQLREVVAKYPAIDFIEIELTEEKSVENAIMLNEKLETPGECWWKHAMNKTLSPDITYPIFVTSLPKSAIKTTHEYLKCGIGKYEGRNLWTKFQSTGEQVPIGECFRQNIWQNQPLTTNCGEPKYWIDIGTDSPDHDKDPQKCYFPTFMKGGLEAIHEAYPYATILHTVRDAHNWYQSAQRPSSGGLLKRWTENCRGFPQANATNVDAWTEFYDWHTQHIRSFVKHHPSLNYIEIKAEEGDDEKQTLQTLQDNFGFQNSCWGQNGASYDQRRRHH